MEPTATNRPAPLARLAGFLIAALALAPAAQAQSVFINEIHYDNAGGDVGEFVEVAGPAGTDLTDWGVVLYNGNGGVTYGTIALSGTIDDEGNGFGALSFPRSGIQNDDEGLALVNADGNVVQFLSYEGTVTATNGPASGMTSEDIGVDEDPAPPAGQSLQLTGAGSEYDDFVWTGPADDSPGAVNAGQTFVGGGVGGGPIVVTAAADDNTANGNCTLREAVIAANTNAAVDLCAAGTVDGDRIRFAAPFDITLALGQILVTDDVAIDASDVGTVTVDAAGASRIFDVDAAGGAGDVQAVAFTSLALQNGDSRVGRPSGSPDAGGAVDLRTGSEATFTDVDVTDSVAGLNGGGIHGGGNTTIVITTSSGGSSTIRGNEAQGTGVGFGGGGVWGAGTTTITGNVTVTENAATGAAGSGGGVFNEGGVLSITGATISSNSANRAGGGVEDNGGVRTTLTDVTLSDNFIDVAAPGNGGGLHAGGGDVTVNGGSVTGNTAVEGGGLWGSGLFAVDGTTIDGNVATSDDDEAFEGGGGLFNQGGTMTVTNATVSNNTADGDGGPGGAGSGGGAFNNAMGSLTVTDSDFTGNSAARAGGGIEVNGGTVDLTGVDFSGNSTGAAPGNGGALHVTMGTVTAEGGAVTGNTAVAEGGGFWNNAGWTMTVTETSFSGNTASGDAADNGGGGLFNNGGTLVMDDVTVDANAADGASGSGGGVFNGPGGTLTVNGGTISGNSANRAGGGVEDAGGTATLTDVAVTGNFIDVAAPGNGGGLHSGGGDITVAGGLYENNTATEGGALWTSGTLTVESSADGPALINGNVGDGPDADNGGGGIFVQAGTATVSEAVIFGNSATGAAGSGGGIFVNDGASLSMTLGSVSGNEANRAGGGIEVATGGTLSLTQVSVDGNSIATANPGNGGGLHVGGTGSATVVQSTFADNSARQGGGLWVSAAGSLDLDNSTVSGNSATAEGGGVYQVGDGGGAVVLMSATVAENSAATGGGLAIGSVAAETSFSFHNTVIGDNTAGSGPDCAGTFESTDFNLVENTAGCDIVGATGNNVTGQDPDLGPLADNGGPTRTHALLEDSPAIDAGQSAFDVDQRGEPRNDDQDDIGAFERGDDGNNVVACTTDSPLSFDADGDGSPTMVMADDFSSTAGGSFMGASGEFAGVRNERSGGAAIDLSTCSFVTFDPFERPEDVIYSAVTSGTVQPDDVYVLATNGGDQTLPSGDFDNGVFFDSPGAFALVTGTASPGDPVLAFVGPGVDRLVAAVVYDRDRGVFASVGGNATEDEMMEFRRTFLQVFGGAEATSNEDGAEVDLTLRAWPNPSAGRATIGFGLATGGAVQVSVFDALGREVARLADGPLARGRHEVAVQAGSLPAGVYVVRVTTEAGVQTTPLTIAR